jgi:dipeptidyl aminopeptidase/acylaminoacyl peptidase
VRRLVASGRVALSLRTALTAMAFGAAIIGGSAAAQEIAQPPASLALDGVPPIPADNIGKLQPYAEFRPHGFVSWHPIRREMLVQKRHEATAQIHALSEPGVAPQLLTEYPDAVTEAWYQPTTGRYFVFLRAEGGNEVYRVYRYDIGSREVTALSPEGERAQSVAWSPKGDRIAFTTQRVDRNNPERTARTSIHVLDPMLPRADRVLATLEGGGWGELRFSEDGRQLAMVEMISVAETHLWVMDITTAKKRRVTPVIKGSPVFYDAPQFTRDGKSLIAISDRGSEYKRLVLVPLAGGAEQVLTQGLSYDVSRFDISLDANRIAFTTNELGSDVLRTMDLSSFREYARPALVDGVITHLRWRRKSDEIAFDVASARTAGDVFSYDVRENRLTRWTNGNNPAVNTRELVEPRLIHWKSFDGLAISGFHYQPPERFTGKRPVIVNIHGGPESQARPGFIHRNNYFVSELGIAMIFPNVRGSDGFGKTFLTLDNWTRREDSVKDIGALLDWIATQPDLDASKVMIMGGSYGGYMSLASSFHFADRIAGSVSIVGISNFVTFLENTESYRRDLRRVEYGDERDPKIRKFMESIAPLNNADKMTKPLLIVQGANDPRVPASEAAQIVETLKKHGTPAWYIVGKDEGHGFAKKPNIDYMYGAIVEFARRTLLQ